MLLGFILGLCMGLVGLLWQRLRTRAQLIRLLNEINPEGAISAFSPVSQLFAAIASQKAYSRSLQSRIQRYQFMLTSAPIAFLHVDDENRLVWCNPLAQKLFNISQSQFPAPRLLIELVRSYELDELIERVRQHRHPQDQVWTFYPLNTNPARVRKQQSYVLKGFGIPLFDHHVGIFIENRQDITLLKQQRDRWTSDVAHELKTPLTSIQLIAETLQPRVDPSLVKWVDRLIEQSTRLSTLVQDLLDLSQLEGVTQAQLLDVKSINLPSLIHAVWNSLEPIAGKKHVRFQYTGPDTLHFACDESKMYRVLSNLLDNSIKYSPTGEVIDITVHLVASERWIQLDVMDRGAGFLEDDLPYIFERFYRADTSRSRISVRDPSISSSITTIEKQPVSPNTAERVTERMAGPNNADAGRSTLINVSPLASGLTATKASQAQEFPQSPPPSGTGLGLAIVQQIIEAHGGEIEADNRLSQSGAIIRIRLPLAIP